MAPSQKRKPIDDDFIHTLSDDDDIPLEADEVAAEPPKKKAKTAKVSKKAPKKNSESDEEDIPEGIWGTNDGDDGAMDSDFEFGADDADIGTEEFEGWGFDGAKKGMNGDKKGVDLDEIIRRRREKRNGKATDKEVEAGGQEEEEEEEADDVENDMEVDLDDDDDEVLADDAFGMNAASDEEASGDEEHNSDTSGAEDDDEAASDDDSVATPVGHPDDDEEPSDASGDEDEDAEEEAKRKAFFAPEEPTKSDKKSEASSFQTMSLSRPIMRGLATVGFSKPTPIQAKTIPIALMGKDLVGGAVTGSGKTGAFIVPILERLLYRPKKIPTTRVVILTPTRELAIQCHAVGTKLAAHTDIKFTLAVGGLSLKMQEVELRLRPDVIIATPGRFIDHMRNSASFNTDTVEILVLDEADRMLEDGFAEELNEILNTLPKSRQTMLFSATMTSTVDRLIRVGMNKPARVMVDSQKKTVSTLVQEFVRLRPGREEKRLGYLAHICKTLYTERVIIFFRQKKDAHRARIIFGLLGLSCAELHGSMNQTQRIASVEDFRDGKVSYLLATDLASRGLDIKGVDTVINYEAPQSLEIYVHRVGRTARAGRRGTAITLAAEPDRKVVKAAVKAGKAQGAKIVSRIIEAAEADKWQAEIDEMDDEIDEIMKEEKEEKQLAHVEMQVKKGENLIEHEAEIKSRPKRTWFETEQDKKKSKTAGREELNKDSAKKHTGKLSNKDKKKLDVKALRAEGKEWRKGKNSESELKARMKENEKAKAKGRAKANANAGDGAKAPAKGKAKAAPKGKRRPSRVVLAGTASKLAPFRTFGPGRPHPRHKQSLVRFLFPRAVRDRYRERLLHFHLETLPILKHRTQSRIYRYIVERQRRRAEQSRILDIVARQGRRLWLGPQAHRPPKHAKARTRDLGARKLPATPSGMTSYYGTDTPGGERERGYRRKKLAMMAGNLYRTGQAAVTEIRESYAQTRATGMDRGFDTQSRTSIPSAFPEVAISVQGNNHLILFPSYAKQHTKRDWSQASPQQRPSGGGTMKDEGYWRQEWERNEDERATIDVDVRGWVYSPQVGPMTRRNRILLGLARQLSGIPKPDQGPAQSTGPSNTSDQLQEDEREQERIDHEAKRIERLGQMEKRVAYRGGYSEKPQESQDGETDGMYSARSRSGNQSPEYGPASPPMPARTFSTAANDLTEAELAVANANLIARVAPFMTSPRVALPITLFFYNNSTSQSKTVLTNDAGHFSMRAALDFRPTHVRVLASEDLSAVQEIDFIEACGVSVISDIDDTIKKSNISAGAKEIFRNTFVRKLSDLTIEGVKEWFHRMQELGVSFHYCSNSPWQLYPVLATFFKTVGLPPGSLHLKQYSGMLQGIFEPVAERKKSTLNRLLQDFPERKFLLIGDSGEADLEVYTDLALANPGRILAVFIRDVTTPEETGYFDSGFDLTRRPNSSVNLNDGGANAKVKTPDSRHSPGPTMGTLIDFSEEPQEMKIDSAAALSQVQASNSRQNSNSTTDLLSAKKPPPPRPAKPIALRSAQSITELNKGLGISRGSSQAGDQPPSLPPRKPITQSRESTGLHPLSQMQNSSQQTIGNTNINKPAPPPPPPRRRGTPSNTSQPTTSRWSPRALSRRSQNSNLDVDFDPLPPPSAPTPSTFGASWTSTRSGMNSPSGSPTLGGANKKLELWRRRLDRAHEQLDGLGVVLYSWRRGGDVMTEAEGIVKQALADMNKRRDDTRRR